MLLLKLLSTAAIECVIPFILFKHLITLIALLFFAQVTYAGSILNNLINNKKISYLDFVLLKIEFRLYERSRVLGPQFIAYRVF